MQLLLILSAMLSALTGAFGAVRAPVAVEATSVAAPAERRVAVVRRAVTAIVQPLPTLAEVPALSLVTPVFVAAEPLYAGRRRE